MRPRLRYRFVVLGVITLAAVVAIGWRYFADRPTTRQLTLFDDVTSAAGISYTGMTHGAYWGDFDGDRRPDLYVTNHLNAPTLYRNLGGGRFEDVTAKWFPSLNPRDDKHGAAWGDFDNDGRLDLVQLTGAVRGVGTEPKRLFVNRGDHFEDIAEAAGTANLLGRTRMPLWFDFNRDGKLDLFHGAEARFDEEAPPFVFIQDSDRFRETRGALPLASRTAPFCIITELTSSGSPDLVCRIADKGRTAQIFSSASLPMMERDPLPATAFEDIAAGDFDNDGRIDLFLARKNPAPPVSLVSLSGSEVLADVFIDRARATNPVGFRFRSVGAVTFRVRSGNPANLLSTAQVHIGSGGRHPQGLEFTLQPGDKTIEGLSNYRPGSIDGLYVTFAPPDQWELRVSTADESTAGGDFKYQQVAVKITSAGTISTPEAIGEPPAREDAPFRLFMNHNGRLIEESERRGVNQRLVSAVNVVAGDFDNDMHLDLFVVASGDIGKQENVLLLNRGDGRFDLVAHAAGAAGALLGVGDSVTTADFDGDGRLDLLIATGGSMGRSLGLPSDSGSYRLFRNVASNGNHWLEIDLEGTKSNRDGIGARVEVIAGGVRQVRIQDGGIHNRGQNHSRLHFGLGKNTQAEKVTIWWPSGAIQESKSLPADRILRLKEP